jgi:hypothetical protein
MMALEGVLEKDVSFPSVEDVKVESFLYQVIHAYIARPTNTN